MVCPEEDGAGLTKNEQTFRAAGHQSHAVQLYPIVPWRVALALFQLNPVPTYVGGPDSDLTYTDGSQKSFHSRQRNYTAVNQTSQKSKSGPVPHQIS